MSGLKNMSTRLAYQGGNNQQDRMIADKLASLKKALLSSYQAATVTLRGDTKKEFRALINPNKISWELDDKIISIPFQSAPIGSDQAEDLNLQIGDVVFWKNTNTYWIIYSQYLQELAYFRGQMRQCENTPFEIDGRSYYYYLKGPDEKGIDWQKSKHFIFNNLNYTVEIYISNTSATKQLFQRFEIIKMPFKNSEGEIDYRSYEVQAVDDITNPGLLTVYLKDYFTNEWQEPEVEKLPTIDTSVPHIAGPQQVYPFDIVTYEVIGAEGATWSISNNRAKIEKQEGNTITLAIVSGKSGSFTLMYGDIKLNVEILSM